MLSKARVLGQPELFCALLGGPCSADLLGSAAGMLTSNLPTLLDLLPNPAEQQKVFSHSSPLMMAFFVCLHHRSKDGLLSCQVGVAQRLTFAANPLPAQDTLGKNINKFISLVCNHIPSLKYHCSTSVQSGGAPGFVPCSALQWNWVAASPGESPPHL